MEKRKGMGYGLMLLAGLFLWNPIVGMVDVLPDLIGYLLLLVGLSAVADLWEGVREARERFRTIAWIALGEMAAQLFIRFFLSATTSSEDIYKQNTPIWILLFSFVITVLECYFLIPAYRDLFRSLGRLAEQKEAAHLRRNARSGMRYDRMASFSVAFIIGKNLLSFLPELAALSTYAYYQAGTATNDWYFYIRAIRLFAFLPALALTAWWLTRWIRLFASAKKDGAFQSALRREYETKILPNQGLLLGRRLRLSFLFTRLGVAMLPIFMLSWEGFGERQLYFGIELLPDFAATGFLLASIYLLGKFDRIRKIELWFGGGAFCIGIIKWIVCISYYQQFTAVQARYLNNAYRLMTILTILTIVSSLVTAAFFCLYFLRIWRLMGIERSANSKKEYLGRMVWLVVLLSGITAGKIVDQILRPWVGWIWWIPLLLTVALILVLSSVFADLSSDLAVWYPIENTQVSVE